MRPTKPPMKAPRVVRPSHSMESSSTGKLALAATANARPTIKATFTFSNKTPRMIATMPSTTVVMRDTRTSVDEATEVRVSRITTVVLGIVAIILGVLFEKVNVAFMVGLAFAVAASANFPVLLLSMLWDGLTTRGAFIGGFVGLIGAVILTIFSPSIWVAVLGHDKAGAWFPYVSPALFTMPLAFICCWLFSITDRSAAAAKERAAFEPQYVRS